jgi:hypothetical protein
MDTFMLVMATPDISAMVTRDTATRQVATRDMATATRDPGIQ